MSSEQVEANVPTAELEFRVSETSDADLLQRSVAEPDAFVGHADVGTGRA